MNGTISDARRQRALLPALMTMLLAMFVGWPGLAMQESPPSAPPADAQAKKIRFSFNGATLEQVVEFFSRETGLPVVRETDVPKATFTYHAPEAYEMAEALRVLNILLQTQGVMLRVDKAKLYLQKLDAMVKETLPTYQGEVPDSVTDDQIVVCVVPLQNAMAKPLGASLAAMVGAYGSVTVMEAQNSLVIVETAGKIRQLLQIVSNLDRADPEGVIRIFKIRHARASALMTPLRALLAEKVQKFVINQQGQQQKIEEENIRGLTISHDDRTNSIVAKGMQAKIDQLEQAIALLDVPGAGEQRLIRTFALLVLTPADAIQKLGVLFEGTPRQERPTMLPLADTNRVVVIGSETDIAQSAALLREIDGGGEPRDDVSIERAIVIAPLEHATPEAAAGVVQSLLNPRQAATTKLIPGADGRSLIISGLTRDVDMVKSLLPILDTPAKVDRDVRMIRIAAVDPQAALDKARALYEKRADAADPTTSVAVELDVETRTATLVGARPALDRFAEALRLVETNAVVERERRQFQVTSAEPSAIAAPLVAMARQLLQPPDGTPYVEPQIEPVDALDLLLVTASPAHFAVLENLVATLDRPQPGDHQFRVISVAGVADVNALLERAGFVYERLIANRPPDETPAPDVEFDELTGSVLVSGRTGSVSLYEQALNEARRLLPPLRDGRMIPIRNARAADVVAPLMELIETATPEGPRPVPAPEIKVIERTNSLYVLAEEPQHAMIGRFVAELDTIEPSDLPPLRLMQVRAADAVQIAAMLRQRYDARPAEQRREHPVTIDADAATNTLIVTAHNDLYEEISNFVDTVNDAGATRAERETRLFPLKLARAADVASALEKLYPEPPMPLDSRGRPLPHLREPKEVFVSADANTNTLIVEAPAERMQSFVTLVEQLDRVQLPPQAELRTYRVERGDLNKIVETLNRIRDQLVKRPEDGSNPVQVTIEGEPQSRTLIVAGDEVTFRKVEQVLKDLSAVAVPREMRVIEVTRTDPADLAQRALAVYQDLTRDDPAASEVEVEVDADHGSIVAVAEPTAMVRFLAVVNQLQASIGPPADVRLLTLQYAKPSGVVQFLEELTSNEIVRFGEGAGKQPTYFAMDRLNAVLVAARPDQHNIIKAVVDSLDKQEAQDMPPLRILQLRTADAQNFAAALMTQYNQRSADERRDRPVSIAADPNTNSLMVAAHPDLLPEIQAVVNDLNDMNRVGQDGREIRIFPLKVARAEELARVLDEMYPEPEPLYDARGRVIPGSKQPREVVVRADAQTNSLIVDAQSQRMAGFEQLVEQLDRQQLNDESEIRTYPVVHANLDALAASMRQLKDAGAFGAAGDRRAAITITTEPVSQTLVVAGPPEIYPKLEKVLQALDVRPAGPTTTMRFFRLTSARAETVAPMLRDILVARVATDVPGAASGASAEALLNVTADRKTNTIILSAPEAVMPMAELLIQQLDQGGSAAIDPVVRVRPLTFANAAEVTGALSQALPNLISKQTGDPVDVRLIPSGGANAIILVGLEGDLPQVEELIAGLDKQQDTESMDAESISLTYANAATIAPILQRLLTNQQKTDPRIVAQRLRTSRGQLDLTPEIQVEADARTNSVIVSGTRQTVELARTLVKELDKADDASDRTYATFTPGNAKPQTLIDTVRRVMESTRPTGRRSTLELIAEPNSGAIVIIGTQAETEQATELLAKWDADSLSAPAMDLKIIPLQHSDAAVLAGAVTPMLRDPARWPRELRELSERGIAVAQPTVTPDPASNRLLVSAPPQLLAMASELVSQLDAPRGSGVSDIRIFNLQVAKAQDVATAVQQSLAARAKQRPGEPAAVITAEPSSNSVIVTATPEQLTGVESIIASLDSGVGGADRPQVRAVFLKHARAETVAPVVEQLLASDDQIDLQQVPNWMRAEILRQRAGSEQPAAIRVAADTRLNAVVISASAQVLDVAEALVTQLDVDPTGRAPSRTVRVLTIDNADPAQLAGTLETLFADDDSGEPAPVIRVDAASETLIVRATPRQHEMIEAVASQVDRAAIGARREIGAVPIDPSRATAREVADTLKRLLDRRGAAGGNGGSRIEVITIEELMRSRSGGASESKREGAAGEGSAAEAQAPSAADDQPDSSGEQSASASLDIRSALVLSLFAAMQDANSPKPATEGHQPPADSGDADVTIAVDEATNSLIVLGPPRAVERIRDLARQIQAEMPQLPGRVRYIALPPAVDASAVAQLVTQTLQQVLPPLPMQPGSPGPGRGQPTQQRVSILADTVNNALIVSANEVDFQTVADLLLALTQPAATDRVVVKVYPLERITADRAAESVRELIGVASPAGAGGAQRPRGQQTDRMRRNLELQLRAQGRTIDAVFDPSLIRVTSDPATNSVLVMGAEESIRFIDQFIELIDQRPTGPMASLKMFPLRHARAADVQRPLQDILNVRYDALDPALKRTTIRPAISIDARTNMLLVTASPEHLTEVETLLSSLDVELGESRHPLRMVEVKNILPSQAQRVLEQAVIGSDQQIRNSTTILPSDDAGMLLVRASPEVNTEIDAVLAEIDRDATRGFEVRTITLQRASAEAVADTLRQLYDDRAQMARQGRGQQSRGGRRVSIVGDAVSNTLVVAASDEDYQVITDLVSRFDSVDAIPTLQFRVFSLQHAKAVDIVQTVQELVQDLTWNQGPMIWGPWGPMFGGGGRSGGRGGAPQGTLAIRSDSRLNAIIATGEGDKFTVVEEIVRALDAPLTQGSERLVRLYPVRSADLAVVTDMIERTVGVGASSRARRPWDPPDPGQIIVRPFAQTRTLIVSGTTREHEEVASIINLLDKAGETPGQTLTVLPVEFTRASDAARILNQFLVERAKATNRVDPPAVIVPSEAGAGGAGNLLISANEADLATIRDLLDRIDQPISDGRVIRIIALKKGDAQAVARIIGQVFGTRGGQGVVATADVRTNSLILNAPQQALAAAEEMVATLDSPPPSENMIIRIYALTGAQAAEAVRLLADTLDLNAQGETQGVAVKLDELEGESVVVQGKIIADRRSNSLIVRATPESFPVIDMLIQRLDEVPVKSPTEWRIIKLKNALAFDVALTLRQFLRQPASSDQPEPRIDYNEPENQLFISATADQFKQIESLLAEIDLPKARPVTRFVKLEYASAESVREALSFFYGPFAIHAKTPDQINTRIVANPPKSLLISAAEAEWENIQTYIKQFDSEEFDPSLQLRVIPLKWADASSVAQAINDAFQAQVQGGRGNDPRTQGRPTPPSNQGDGERRDQNQPPLVLVEAADWVRAGAEPQTNTVIVSANRDNMLKIEAIVAQIDNAEFAQGPAPRVIPVTVGSPTQFAQSLTEVFQQSRQGRGQPVGRQPVRIIANEASSSLIVRAEDDEFQQIVALSDALQQRAGEQGLNVHVLTLTAAPAARVEAAIRDAFQAKAQQTRQPLSIRSEPSGNSLIIACTAALFAEIEQTVKQLDSLQPAAGQGIFIIELQNVDPASATSIIQTIGLDKPQPPDSVSRLVTEPIRVSAMQGRNALIVIANPADRDTIVSILKAIDSEPAMAEVQMRMVRLTNAKASAVSQVLTQMLQPANQQANTPLARAIQEQVRRLSLRRNGANQPDLQLDLTKPIRLIPNDVSNTLIVSSTEANLNALVEIVASLDTLPITDAVVVQIIPLENIRAEDFQRIVNDLFTQGKSLGSRPGAQVQGVPSTTTGRALAGPIAMTVDGRTNTLMVAGSEEAVAFVEVMRQRLDSDVAVGWVEPRLIPLKHADAAELAATIQAILVDGAQNLPQSTPLQNQIARIRTAQGQGGAPGAASDVFVPMTRLVVRADEQLNALVVVGTRSNLDAIQELVAMFDIEQRSRDNRVRIYPVKHASASRLQTTISRLFDQQQQRQGVREEDRVFVTADERTNALIVSTSPRSFEVLESLLEKLDAQIPTEFAEIRSIPLRSAAAQRLATAIQQLMDARLERLRRVEPETAEMERATIVADTRTNSLIVAASNDSFGVIQRLVTELDTPSELAGGGMQVLPVTKGNVERLAEMVRQVMTRRYADVPQEIRNAQQPLVLTDPRTNSLLIAANPEDFESIRRMVADIEAIPMNPAVAITVVPVENKRAEQLAPKLQQLMADRIATLGPARTDADRVSIQADTASNSLIVAASDENLEVIRGLIDALAKAEQDSPAGVIEVINLARSRATDLIRVVDELYVQEQNRKRGDNTVRVTANDRLNALIVSASEQDVAAVKGLVERLEGRGNFPIVEIQTITLTAADPLEIVGLVEEVLRGPGTTGRRNAQQSVIFKLITEAAQEDGVVRQDATDEIEISTAIRETISLTPDRRTNSVIVAAPRESMTLIRKLIDSWDKSTASNQNLRIFTLQNADADATAKILAELFRTPNREVLTPVTEQPPAGLEGEVMPLSMTQLTTVPDERKQLAITVDSRTNSLIVAGTPRYLDLVEQVVQQLDSETGNERTQLVYPLKNAVAEEVARVVANFVDADQRKLLDTIPVDQLGAATRLLEREVTIIGDRKSNTLLVSASPRYMPRVMDMIQQLDVDPPQVLIQVLLAEITLDGGDEWGVKFNASRKFGDVNVGGGFGLASAFLSGMGVPNLSVAGTDFDLLIRALKSQGRLQVLSNPSIMAANNERAEIQIGETIRVPTGQSITSGQVVSTVEAQDIGVILNVTPTINPDGYVRMEINPEISNLSARTTQVNENFSAPIITKRRADTTVTVADGQTIVIGGLISDRFEIREEAVPWISDLPILGALFRSRSEQRAKTELLIVLTPHVITSPTDMPRSIRRSVEEATQDEIDRLSVPEEVKEQIRRGVLEGTGGLYDASGKRIDRPLDGLETKSTKSHRVDLP